MAEAALRDGASRRTSCGRSGCSFRGSCWIDLFLPSANLVVADEQTRVSTTPRSAARERDALRRTREFVPVLDDHLRRAARGCALKSWRWMRRRPVEAEKLALAIAGSGGSHAARS